MSTEDRPTVLFTAERLRQLIQAQAQAEKQGRSSFMLFEREWDTQYAKYVVEYLQMRFATQHSPQKP